MSVPKIEGRWEGYFQYGKLYGKLAGTKVPFTMDIKNEDGYIRGICTDQYIEENSLDPATIEGSAEDYLITFIKKYPAKLEFDENYQSKIYRNQESYEIMYVGNLQKRFFSNKYFLKGTWEISTSFLDDNGNTIYFTCEGSWMLKPVK